MVDILLATYNGQKYLPAFLESINRQTYNEWKLLVRDDNSTDDTLAIIESFKLSHPNKVEFISKSSHDRIGASRNFEELISVSSSNYIMLADQDDVWFPYKIEKTIKELVKVENDNTTTPVMVFSDMTVVDQHLNEIAESFHNLQKLDPELSKDWKTNLALNVVAGCTVGFNAASNKHLLPFPACKILHDQWLTCAIAKNGKISYIPAPTLKYRQHASNTLGAQTPTVKYFLSKIQNQFNYLHVALNVCLRFSALRMLPLILFYKISLNFRRLKR